MIRTATCTVSQTVFDEAEELPASAFTNIEGTSHRTPIAKLHAHGVITG